MTSSSNSAPLRIAIIGGGIAGLALGIALSQKSNGSQNIVIDLYEAAAKFTETGAGIGMFRRPWQVMKRLRLDEKIKAISMVPEPEDAPHLAFRLCKADDPSKVEHVDLVIPFGPITLHRVEFLDLLAHELEGGPATIHFNKRLVKYEIENDGSLLLHFKDTSIASCDVLIGADGIYSATRQNMVSMAIDEARAADDVTRVEQLRRPGVKDPTWTGTSAYRNVISSEQLRALNPNHPALEMPINYLGRHGNIVAFPISRGKYVNFVGLVVHPELEGSVWEGHSVQQRSKEELRASYEGWVPEVEQLIKCIESSSMWAINTLDINPIASHGSVAIMGDAAHAMTPYQGSGAGQAIEDAYVLASLLSHPSVTRGKIPLVLKIYEKVRLPRANEIQRLSKENGKLIHFCDYEKHPELSTEAVSRDGVDLAQLLKGVVTAMETNWRWAWTTDVEDEKDEAMRMLAELA